MHRTQRLDSISDTELVKRLCARLSDHRGLEAEVVAYLAEVDRRRLYLERAMPSMHDFCVRVLHMSDGQTYRRIAVARASRKYPVLLSTLADGRVHLSGLAMLVPHLTGDNVDEVLARAVHKSKREIEALVAELSPKPDVAAAIRRLPRARAAQEALPPGAVLSARSDAGPRDAVVGSPSSVDGSRSPVVDSRESVVNDRSSGADPRIPALLEPIAPARYKVQFTASQELQGKLRRAQALLRHREHGGDLAEVIDEAMTLLLSKLEARRQGKAKRPRKTVEESDTSARSRRIPVAVVRAVYERDQARCAFVDKSGRRCPCEDPGLIEVHHVVPYARGGDHSVDNLELRCQPHNWYEAELDYGAEVMARHRKGVDKLREVGGVYAGWVTRHCTVSERRRAGQPISLPEGLAPPPTGGARRRSPWRKRQSTSRPGRCPCDSH